MRKVLSRFCHIPDIDDSDHIDCQKYFETIEFSHDIRIQMLEFLLAIKTFPHLLNNYLNKITNMILSAYFGVFRNNSFEPTQ